MYGRAEDLITFRKLQKQKPAKGRTSIPAAELAKCGTCLRLGGAFAVIFQRIRAYLSRKRANAEERSEVTKPGKPTIWNIKRATDRGNTDFGGGTAEGGKRRARASLK